MVGSPLTKNDVASKTDEPSGALHFTGNEASSGAMLLRRTARAMSESPSTSRSDRTRRRQMIESSRVKVTCSGTPGCCPANPSPGSELSSMVVPRSISRPSSESGELDVEFVPFEHVQRQESPGRGHPFLLEEAFS